ncbi:hypothetical protein CJ030_MR7G016763 [Morella rubra]|uniref:Yippee domain-containing protein n=1 Tax=Morella rubra TaxID=262757 RepID=A0A6A1UXM5_9ROSI|nr:hypothetical protein CJ030_MR7G016763 [Morella rubra]
MAELIGPRVYSCCNCRNHVSLHDDIISKAFQGRHGRAFLFSHAMNIEAGPKEDRHLLTGLHTVADVYCADCHEVLGWKYERAYEASQKYKEGKFILEKSKIVKENWKFYPFENSSIVSHSILQCALCPELKALWAEGVAAKESPESELQQEPAATAVQELVKSLTRQRLYREVTLALKTGLRDARAEFSFLRVRGLRSLLKFLRSVAESDSTIQLFCQTQSLLELQVVPALFQHSLREPEEEKVENLDHIFGVAPLKITSPSTDAEVALALRVLEGCCLLHRESTALAHHHKAIEILSDFQGASGCSDLELVPILQVLMKILSTRGVLEQGACIDALISIMLDSSPNQMDFEACNGIEEIADIIRDKQVDENLRVKCGEFLLLLIGHVNMRERPPLAAIHDDIRRLLGEKSASLIWAASQFGSTLDPKERLTALHIQAGRVLESLDLY